MPRAEHSDETVACYGDGCLGWYLVVVRMIRRFDGIGPEHGCLEFRRMITSLP